MGESGGLVAKRVLIVDDHPVLRRGMAMLINEEDDLTVCGEAEGIEDAIEAVSAMSPDIVLVDISLKEANGLDLIRQLHKMQDDLPMLVLSAHDEERYAERAIRLGAMGYVMKEEDLENVVAAIRRVLQGEIFLSRRMMPKVLTRLARKEASPAIEPQELLSNREFEVFRMIGHGMRTNDIAGKLGLSPKTVQVHRDHIKAKLSLRDTVSLQHEAFAWVHGDLAP